MFTGEMADDHAEKMEKHRINGHCDRLTWIITSANAQYRPRDHYAPFFFLLNRHHPYTACGHTTILARRGIVRDEKKEKLTT